MKCNHPKTIICLVCTAVIMLNVCASAAASDAPARSYVFTANGRVAEPPRITLTAPIGGQVQNFGWQAGDAAGAGNIAFSLLPVQVLAAGDGIVRGLHAQVGDQAAQIISIYGALCHIERDRVWQVEASAASAYNDAENRDVRIGDILRIQQGSGDSEVTGTGEVVRLIPRGFVVELPLGGFELEKTVKFYRGTGEAFKSRDQVGSGKIARPSAVPVLGDGCIAAVHVQEGQSVRRGQPLFTLDAASARHTQAPAAEVLFGMPGIVAEVLVRPGQFVTQGQAVMTLMPTSSLNISLEVDELDIAKVSVGQSVRVVLDAYADQERMGTVREIKPLGNVVQDITKFVVLVSIEDASGLMIGMHAKGYWGR